jgi:hypothetical protein
MFRVIVLLGAANIAAGCVTTDGYTYRSSGGYASSHYTAYEPYACIVPPYYHRQRTFFYPDDTLRWYAPAYRLPSYGYRYDPWWADDWSRPLPSIPPRVTRPPSHPKKFSGSGGRPPASSREIKPNRAVKPNAVNPNRSAAKPEPRPTPRAASDRADARKHTFAIPERRGSQRFDR